MSERAFTALELVKASPVRGLARYLLLVFLLRANDEAIAWGGVAKLAELAGLDPSTDRPKIRAALRALEDAGELVCIYRSPGGRGKPNKYRVVRLTAAVAESPLETGAQPHPFDHRKTGAETGAERGPETGAHGHPEVEVEVEEEETPPTPPRGARHRDLVRFVSECEAFAATHFADLGRSGGRAVKQAIEYGNARTLADVETFVNRWWRQAA